MARKKKLVSKPKQNGLPLWIGTFGDLMSLLLTFFILLLSMATFVKEKVELAAGSLQGALSVLERGIETEITPPNPIQATPLEVDSQEENVMNIAASLIAEYNEMVKISDGPSITLEESQDGFIIRIPDDLLFNTGSTTISNNSGLLFLQRLSMQVDNFKKNLQLKIVGNTDNVQFINGSKIDNWDLSTKRALSVSNELVKFGVPINIIQAGGNGEFDPIASNATKEGRAKNRRVDIYFREIDVTMDNENKAKEIIKNLQGNQ